MDGHDFDDLGRIWHHHPHQHPPEVAALPGQHDVPDDHGHLHARASYGVYDQDYDHHDVDPAADLSDAGDPDHPDHNSPDPV
jgi:hypothetical protein